MPRETWVERIRLVRAQGMGAIVDAALGRFFTPAFRAANPGYVAGIRRTLEATDPRGYAACGAAIRDMDLLPRLGAIAVIAPLRHPLLLAKELGTLDLLAEGRLIVQPTVSWHRDEYEALGVPFDQRGRLLDEHLEAWRALWTSSPASFAGEHYAFEDVWLEPKAWRPEGPTLWFGGERVHPRLLRRLVRHGHGFHPLGPASAEDLRLLAEGLAAAGRGLGDIELVGGMRSPFPDERSPAYLGPALESIRPQWEQGFRTFCVKPNQYVDELAAFPGWCDEVVARVAALNLEEAA